jgi:hypothetical protein
MATGRTKKETKKNNAVVGKELIIYEQSSSWPVNNGLEKDIYV